MRKSKLDLDRITGATFIRAHHTIILCKIDLRVEKDEFNFSSVSKCMIVKYTDWDITDYELHLLSKKFGKNDH